MRLLLTILACGLSWHAYAAELRHSIAQDASGNSLQTLGICGALPTHLDQAVCSPSLFLDSADGAIEIEILGQANEEGVSIAQRLDSGDVDGEFFSRLFADQNFQSFSGVARIGTYVGKFALLYVPAHVAGGIKLENPALPVIHAGILTQSLITVQYNFLVDLHRDYSLLIGPSISGINRKFIFLDADLLTLSVSDADALIQKDSKALGDGDLSIGIVSSADLIPSVYLTGRNLASASPCADCEDPFVDTRPIVTRSFDAKISSSVRHPLGTSIFATQATLRGNDSSEVEPAFSYAYRLSKLSSFVSVSPIINSFGFIFDADFYNLGIRYTSEKQPNSLAIDRIRNTYVIFKLAL